MNLRNRGLTLLYLLLPIALVRGAVGKAVDKHQAGAVRIADSKTSLAKDEMAGLTPAIFSDHMVLQRQLEVPVWGTTEPGGTVTVTFMNQTKTATADANGKWMVKLDKMKAVSEPQELIVKDAKEARIYKNVLVGDVWLCSGQSNMEFGSDFSYEFKVRRAQKEKKPSEGVTAPTTMGDCVDEATKQVLRRAIGNPLIRVSSKTRDHLTTRNTGWELVDEQNVITLSALAGCIAVHLQEELKVPVGIIVRSVSATAMARWIQGEAFLNDPLVKQQLEAYRATGKNPALTGTSAKQGFGNLYREYIVPVRPYAIRGFLWDQGEWGIGYRGTDWTAAMKALVTDWRKDWGQGDLPWSATDHYGKENTLEASLKAQGISGFMIAKVGGLSSALHPLNKEQFAQRHLDNIFPQIYGLPAPKWPAVPPEGKSKPVATKP